MDRSGKEVMVKVNKKATVITNCASNQYLTCDIPVKLKGELRADKQHRWTSGTAAAVADEEVTRERVDDVETPMMPVFLPGYLSSPSSSDQTDSARRGQQRQQQRFQQADFCEGGSKSFKEEVRETVVVRKVDDIETPMMPVFLPGYLSSPPPSSDAAKPENEVRQQLQRLSVNSDSDQIDSGYRREVVTETITTRRVQDIETPMMPVFLPGYTAAPQTARAERGKRSANDPQGARQRNTDEELRTVVYETVSRRQADDTETPMMPVFLPGYCSAPKSNSLKRSQADGNPGQPTAANGWPGSPLEQNDRSHTGNPPVPASHPASPRFGLHASPPPAVYGMPQHTVGTRAISNTWQVSGRRGDDLDQAHPAHRHERNNLTTSPNVTPALSNPTPDTGYYPSRENHHLQTVSSDALVYHDPVMPAGAVPGLPNSPQLSPFPYHNSANQPVSENQQATGTGRRYTSLRSTSQSPQSPLSPLSSESSQNPGLNSGQHRQRSHAYSDDSGDDMTVAALDTPPTSTDIDSQLNSMIEECTAYIDSQLNTSKSLPRGIYRNV